MRDKSIFYSGYTVPLGLTYLENALFYHFSSARALSTQASFTQLTLKAIIMYQITGPSAGSMERSICYLASTTVATSTVFGLCMLKCRSLYDVNTIYACYAYSPKSSLCNYFLSHSTFGEIESSAWYLTATTAGYNEIVDYNGTNAKIPQFGGFHINPNVKTKVDRMSIVNISGNENLFCADSSGCNMKKANFIDLKPVGSSRVTGRLCQSTLTDGVFRGRFPIAFTDATVFSNTYSNVSITGRGTGTIIHEIHETFDVLPFPPSKCIDIMQQFFETHSPHVKRRSIILCLLFALQ